MSENSNFYPYIPRFSYQKNRGVSAHTHPAVLIIIEEQRENVCKYIQDEITSLAKELPVHKVLPYNNVGRKNYPNSK